MQNSIHWVEIPTTNIERAVGFYNNLLSIEMKVMEVMNMKTAFFLIPLKRKVEAV